MAWKGAVYVRNNLNILPGPGGSLARLGYCTLCFNVKPKSDDSPVFADIHIIRASSTGYDDIKDIPLSEDNKVCTLTVTSNGYWVANWNSTTSTGTYDGNDCTTINNYELIQKLSLYKNPQQTETNTADEAYDCMLYVAVSCKGEVDITTSQLPFYIADTAQDGTNDSGDQPYTFWFADGFRPTGYYQKFPDPPPVQPVPGQSYNTSCNHGQQYYFKVERNNETYPDIIFHYTKLISKIHNDAEQEDPDKRDSTRIVSYPNECLLEFLTKYTSESLLFPEEIGYLYKNFAYNEKGTSRLGPTSSLETGLSWNGMRHYSWNVAINTIYQIYSEIPKVYRRINGKWTQDYLHISSGGQWNILNHNYVRKNSSWTMIGDKNGSE